MTTSTFKIFKRFCIFLLAFFISEIAKVTILFSTSNFGVINFYPQSGFMANEYLKSILSKFTPKESLFVKAILSKNKESAKSIAYEIYGKSPHYLLFFYVLNKKENKPLVLKLMSSIRDLDLNLVYLLCKSEDFSYEDIKPFHSMIVSDSSIGLCIEKSLFLKKYSKISNLDTVERIKISTELTSLINKIDDFSLYDFAIKNQIQLVEKDGTITFLGKSDYPEYTKDNMSSNFDMDTQDQSNLLRNSVNMAWYKIIQNRDSEVARKLILLPTNISDIKKILDYCPLKDTGSLTYDILIKYLNNEDPKKLLESSFKHLVTDNSFISTKVLLTLLIATKDEKLLLLALQISESAKFEDNYEITLISMFLCRYFLLFSKIRKIFHILDIKNIQLHNLAYIWSDPMIVTNVKLSDETSHFRTEISNTLSNIEKSLVASLDNSNIAVAYSLFELRESLVNSVIANEVSSKKITSTSPFSMFSDFLGEPCRFLFDKLVVEDKRQPSGSIPTLRTVPEFKFSDKVFENDFMNITNPDLIASIQKNISCFK